MKQGIYLLFTYAMLASFAVSLMGSPVEELAQAGSFDKVKASFYALYGYTAQEKYAAYRKLIALEQQKSVEQLAYEQAMQGAKNDVDRVQLQDEYNKKIEDLSQLIRQQQLILGIVVSPQRKLFWQVAKVLGTTAILGLLAYKTLVTSSVMTENKDQLMSSPDKTQKPILTEEVSTITTEFPAEVPTVTTEVSSDAQLVPNITSIKESVLKQMASLYRTRYENLMSASDALSLASIGVTGLVFAGVPSLFPLNLALLPLGGLLYGGAAYYKNRLKFLSFNE